MVEYPNFGNDIDISSNQKYRVILVVLELGCIDLYLRYPPGLVGSYGSYLLPKQDGGTSQNEVNPTQL